MNSLTIQEVEDLYTQLIEHLGDRFSPEEAVNRATDIIAKYLNIEA